MPCNKTVKVPSVSGSGGRMQTNLNSALPFAQAGWKLFPAIWKNGHKPLIKWGAGSTNSLEQLKTWAAQYPGCYFCVNLRSSKIVVIDVDNKNDKHGSTVLKKLPALPTTMTSATPSAGAHYYYRGACATGANKLGAGVDIPVMVPLPGQHVPGKGVYKLVQKGVPAPLPSWVVTKAGKKKEKKEAPGMNVDLDKPENLARAITYLKNAPEAIEGAGGDNVTYNVACKLRDFGLSEDTTVNIMMEHWNPIKAAPPWEEKDLREKVTNAFKYALDVPGNSTPESMFGRAEEAQNQYEVIRCAADITYEDVRPREWLLWSRYLRKNITVTVAPGGAGKSALAIVEGLSLASGKNLVENSVKEKTAVWYYNTEDDFDELNRRIRAATLFYKLNKTDLCNFYFTSGRSRPLILVADDRRHGLTINHKAVEWLIGEIKKRNAGLFILDPFVRCHQVQENDNGAIDLVVQQLQKVADQTNCAISIVHHVSKGGGDVHGNLDKMRGASSLAGACRIAHTFYSMSEKEGKLYGFSGKEYLKYSRLDNAKANLTPRGTEEMWYQHHGVKMNWDSDETVGTVACVKLEGVREESPDTLIAEDVMRRVGPGRERTIYSLAVDIEKNGVTFKKRTIMRKIEAYFSTPRKHKGLEWGVKAQGGVMKIRCEQLRTINGS